MSPKPDRRTRPLAGLLGRLRRSTDDAPGPAPRADAAPWPPASAPASAEQWRACLGGAPEGDAQAIALLKRFAEQAAARDDVPAELLLELAAFWQKESSWATVTELAGRALTSEAESVPARLLLADAQYRRSLPAQAIGTLTDALPFCRTDADRARVRLRIAEAQLALDRFDEAWPVYAELGDSAANGPELGISDLLNLAYCAVRLGRLEEAERAYARSYPLPGDRKGRGFDRLKAAGSQLRRFQRTEEALRLLAPLGAASSGPELWLAHRASLLEEDFPRALELLELARERDPGSEQVLQTLGQLLELCGHDARAVEAYRGSSDAFAAYRAGALLHAAGDTRGAVEHYLSVADPGREDLGDDFAAALAAEADPQAVGDFAEFLGLAESGTAARTEQLAALFPRLGDERLVNRAGRALARLHAELDDWPSAWLAISQAQSRHLPAVSLRKSGRLAPPSPETIYAEMRDALPLDEHLVLWESNLAESTSCNPLALCLTMLDDPAYGRLWHTWILEPGATIHPRLLGRRNVRFVAPGSFAHLRALATAGHIVNNSTYESFFAKREGQRYLSTWHGIPWKTLGLDKTDAADEMFAISGMQRSSLHADVIIAPDEHTMRVLTRSVNTELLTTATLMRTGYPRNDLARQLDADARDRIRAELGLAADEKLVLFMPTWRGRFRQRNAEVEHTLQQTRELAGTAYRVALRAHHYVRQSFQAGPAPEDILLAPEHIDTYELLGAADALVTDYSSVLFDAASLGMPVVKLVGDIDGYRAERGLYFGPDEVPGANVADAVEARAALSRALQDPQGFTDAYRAATERFGGSATGTASRDVIDVFFGGGSPAEEFPPPAEDGALRLLLYGGALEDDERSRRLVALLAELRDATAGSDGAGIAAHLFVQKRALERAGIELSTELSALSRVIPYTAAPSSTVMEGEALAAYTRPQFRRSALVLQHLSRLYLRDAVRQFGRSGFDSVVDFSGEDPRQTAFFALGLAPRSSRSGIVLHGDWRERVEADSPGLAASARLLDAFDVIATLPPQLTEANRAFLEAFGVPAARHLALTEARLLVSWAVA